MGAKDTLIKSTVIISIAFSLIAFSIMLLLTAENEEDKAKNLTSMPVMEIEELDFIKEFTLATNDVPEENKRDYLRLTLPEGVREADVKIKNTYIDRILSIRIPDVTNDYFKEYPLVGSSDHISSLSYALREGSAYIELILDGVYEYESIYEEGYLYLKFISPKDLYDKIIVIDPGHGGVDGGTVGNGLVEKDINLQVCLKLKALLDNTDIRVYYTRIQDTKPTYEERVALANDLQADMFISIHANADKVTSSSGTEILYNEMSAVNGFGSRELAIICQEEIVSSLGSRDRGLIPGSSIYIIRNAKVPVALVELGFLTDTKEAKLLSSSSYQMDAAQGILNGILRVYEENGHRERKTKETQVVENE